MSLNTIPKELLILIGAKITSQSSLCNLARCSRELYDLSIPRLYSHIDIHEEVRDGTEQKDHKSKVLAATLIIRPDLAQFVREFSLQVTRAAKIEDPDSYDIPRAALTGEADFTPVNPSGLSLEEIFKLVGRFVYVHKMHHDWILSLLLPTMLNVERLTLDVTIPRFSHFFEKAMVAAGRKEPPFAVQPRFQNLKSYIHSHSWGNISSVSLLASLLKFPRIQEISGAFQHVHRSLESDDWHDDEGNELADPYDLEADVFQAKFTDRNLLELETSSSGLLSLDLAQITLDKYDLKHIFRAPRALVSLSLDGNYSRTFRGVRNALKPHRDCLQSLTIYCEWNMMVHHDGDFIMPSFKRFRALKSFTTAAVFLEAKNPPRQPRSLLRIFPPQLETLRITNFQTHLDGVLEALARLMARKSRLIPSLENLILEEQMSRTGTTRLSHVLLPDTQEAAVTRMGRFARLQDVNLELVDDDDRA